MSGAVLLDTSTWRGGNGKRLLDKSVLQFYSKGSLTTISYEYLNILHRIEFLPITPE